MSRLEQLKIQAKASLEAAITKAKEEAEERRYNAIISGGVDRVMAISAVKEATSEELKAVEMACSMIVKDLPLTNKATREIRKWNPSRVYGYGNQIGALVGILSGIQYSAAEHRLQMLATTGLNEQIIEDTLNAFGSPSYFSAKYETIVPEKPYCINSIKNSLEVLEIKLNINLDKDAITEELLSKQFESARLRAETERNNYLVTKQTKTITVEG
jgi:hypothetical protein